MIGLDVNGAVLDRNGIIDGNALLYSAIYYDNRSVPFPLSIIYGVTVFPGLINRYSKPLQPQAHDDYIGLAAVDSSFAKQALRYGRANWYCWDNINWGERNKWSFRKFFARFPGFVAFLKLCAGEKLNVFDYLSMAVGLLATAIQNDGASGYQLDYIQHRRIARSGNKIALAISKAAIRVWKLKGVTAKAKMLEYHGPDHVISQLIKEL